MNDIITLSNVIDVALVAGGIYLLLIFIKQTRSYSIMYGLGFVALVSFLSTELDLGLTRKMIQPLVTFFLVIFVIVFQSEIRRFFRWLALSRGRLEHRAAFLNEAVASYLTEAIMTMAQRKTGAIIVLSGEYPLDDIIQGGFKLDGKITVPLLLSIFDDSTPGHDGAILIENRRISKFGVHLPLAEEFKGFATMGTRHRAACGITERTDAMALVVSEERGTISVAQGGVLRTLPDRESVEDALHSFLSEEQKPQYSLWRRIFLGDNALKVVSVISACALWFFFIFQANVVTREFVIPFQFVNIAENLTVVVANPAEIKITVTGNNQDIQNLKESDMYASVDLKDKGQGTFKIPVDETSISKPSYVSVITFSPKTVTVSLTGVEEPQP